MNPVSIVSISASLVSLLLSVYLFWANTGAQGLQNDLQKKQQELQDQNQQVQQQQTLLQAQQDQINTAKTLSEQVGPEVLKDVGSLVLANKNEKLRKLLSKYGVTVKEDAAAGASPTPKPAAPASSSSTPAPASH